MRPGTWRHLTDFCTSLKVSKLFGDLLLDLLQPYMIWVLEYMHFLFNKCYYIFSDSKKRLIGVCTIRGKYCQGVITKGVTNPRGIAVQPDQGLLAYSNWDDNLDNHPHIGLAGKDARL